MKHRANIRGRTIITALAASSAVVGSARGQESSAPPATSPAAAPGAEPPTAPPPPPPQSAADPLAAFKTDKGLISLTKVAPQLTPVSDYTGDLWSRAALLGDLGGWRSDLYDRGVTFDLQLTQVLQGVVSGGSAKGHGSWNYNGLLEANLTLDTAKLGMWSGGMFNLTTMTSFGNPLTRQAGNLSPVNQTSLWPRADGDQGTELSEYYLAQALPLNTLVFLGRLDPSNFLDQNSFSDSSDNEFLNVSMNSNPLFGSFLSYSTYAALFMTKVNDNFTLAYGAWTPNTQPGDYGGDWNDFGAAIIPIFNYRAIGQPGMIQVILAYTNKDATDVGNPRLLADVIAGNNLPTKGDNWIVEISGEQYFWEPKGASVSRAEGGRKEEFDVPTQAFAKNRPGMGVFYRFSCKPEDRNAYSTYVSGGIGGRGVVPGRPFDRFGVGAYWLKESGDLESQPGSVLDDEVGVEAFYNIAISPNVQFSIDAQWIGAGIESSDDAVVIGTRLNIRF